MTMQEILQKAIEQDAADIFLVATPWLTPFTRSATAAVPTWKTVLMTTFLSRSPGLAASG